MALFSCTLRPYSKVLTLFGSAAILLDRACNRTLRKSSGSKCWTGESVSLFPEYGSTPQSRTDNIWEDLSTNRTK